MRCMQHPQEVIHEIVWAHKFILINDAQIKCSGYMRETVNVREDTGDVFSTRFEGNCEPFRSNLQVIQYRPACIPTPSYLQ
jgi:hypothetical protein